MMKSAEVLKGMHKTALQKVTDTLTKDDVEMSELELYVWLHRLEEWASVAKKNVRTAANGVFAKLKSEQADKKTWDVTSFAQVTSAARPVSYTYPPEVVDLNVKAAAATAQAKSDGSAKKTVGELDSNVQVLFKVELKEV